MNKHVKEKNMRIHYISHAPFEKLGVIQDWVTQKNYQLTSTSTYKGEILPSVDQFDFLIVMGGPQSAVELDKYPYLKSEITLIQQAIENNKIILGICLGAQLIGQALGAKAEKSPYKEIGVYPVELTEAGKVDPLFKKFSHFFETMHWHSDMPGLPHDAKLLAKSEGCPRQAFSYGDRIYGFQFHFELTPTLVEEMVAHCQNDLLPGEFVQSSEMMNKKDFSSFNQKMYLTLEHLTELFFKQN
jgi:GMP synthase (glutamine-hydrolysing)